MKNMEWPDKAGFIIAAPGFKYIGITGLIAALAMGLGGYIPGGLALCLFVFVCCFFRDPERKIPPESMPLSPRPTARLSVYKPLKTPPLSTDHVFGCVFS